MKHNSTPSIMDFSIIIPAYNVEALIGMCLDSLTAQDYPNDRYEVIVVDDCSPDGLQDVVRDRQRTSSNIVLLKTERNVRQGGARNLGLRHARGRSVLFVDADDMWLRRDVLSTFARIFEKSGGRLLRLLTTDISGMMRSRFSQVLT